MATGLYLSIGLNSVDAAGYNGWTGPLNACENDANDIAHIATQAGLTGRALLTAEATSGTVLSELYAASKALTSGDLLVVSYSGHGGQVGDVTGDEDDGLDETWCLYDRMLIDDELYAMWSHFEPGVRIFVLSDSCHSGTVARMLDYAAFTSAREDRANANVSIGRVKAIPFEKSWETYQSNKALYDSLQFVAGASEKSDIGASVILISGCQDNQFSLDGAQNGMFTGTLKNVFAGGTFKGNYRALRDAIVKHMPPSQTPNYYVVGAPNLTFEDQRPFAI